MAGQRCTRQIEIILSVLVAVVSLPSIARSSEETLCSVMEPIATENYIGLSDVPYVTWAGGWWPGLEISLMEKANCVKGDDGMPGQDRNVVSLCGIGVKVEQDKRWAYASWKRTDSVDTVTVVVDCRKIQPKRVDTATVGNIIDATLECVITNATRSQPSIRNLRLVVRGPGAGERSTKVIHLGDLPAMPRKRVFQ